MLETRSASHHPSDIQQDAVFFAFDRELGDVGCEIPIAVIAARVRRVWEAVLFREHLPGSRPSAGRRGTGPRPCLLSLSRRPTRVCRRRRHPGLRVDRRALKAGHGVPSDAPQDGAPKHEAASLRGNRLNPGPEEV